MDRQENYFEISEFLVDPAMRRPESTVPVHVVQKIQNHHIPILNPIRREIGQPVYISQYSGYRPPEWERSRGRSGLGQHTFGEGQPKSEWNIHWGAVDITTKQNKFNQLLKLLIESDYTRICLYPEDDFIHADWKGHWKRNAEKGFWIAETRIVKEDGKEKFKKEWIQQENRKVPVQYT